MLFELNRAAYKVTRVGLRLLLGKTRRDSVLERIWPGSYDFPEPVLALMGESLRRRWGYHYLAWLQEKSWEPTLMSYITSREGHLFVDVGANLGLYCCKLHKNFDRLIAIEADPDVYQALAKRCPPNCKPINLAVSNHEGYVDFYSATKPTGKLGWRVMRGSVINPNDQEWNVGTSTIKKVAQIRVPGAPLSKILENERAIDLVKVDVEGAEWLVLEGAEQIMPRVKEWVIELHEPSRKIELETWMKRYGYGKCEWIDLDHIAAKRNGL